MLYPCGTAVPTPILTAPPRVRTVDRVRHLLTCPGRECRLDGAAYLQGLALFRKSGAAIDRDTMVPEDA